MLTVAEIQYDPATHRSVAPDGREVPHVTHVLESVGVATDFAGLASFSPKLCRDIEERRALGSAVHADCHAFDDGDLIWESIDPRVLPYVDIAWRSCRENLGLVPLKRERRLYHALYHYTGIMDGLFRDRRQKVILADLKIGDPEDAGAQFQTAAYEAAYKFEHPGEVIDERWAIHLCPQAIIPYRVVNYSAPSRAAEAWTDFNKFQAMLVTYWEQAGRRRPIR